MKRVILASLLVLAASFLTVNFASAKELSDEQKVAVAATCVNAQSNLQRLGSSDTTTRINRGRDYDQVLKLFYAMNTRVASNNITEPKLAEVTKNFENELARFRDNYNSYNDQLKTTTDFGCVGNPQGFYDALEATRARRANLNTSVNKLHDLMEDYQLIVKGLL